MGDTGALALGGAVAGLSILTQTQLLAIIVGGLFVAVVLSDVIQISVFKATGKRVFRMAPLRTARARLACARLRRARGTILVLR